MELHKDSDKEIFIGELYHMLYYRQTKVIVHDQIIKIININNNSIHYRVILNEESIFMGHEYEIPLLDLGKHVQLNKL